MEENKNICSECGTENGEQFKYCKNCGAPLSPTEPPHMGGRQNGNFVNNGGTPYNQMYNTFSGQQTPNQGYNPQYGGYNPPPYQYAGQQYGGNTYSPYDAGGVCGISRDELSAFVGSKAHAIVPKFENMERKNTSVSWCWPAAILSFVLGPMGAALWFFYRKLYKPALLFAAVGVVLSAANVFSMFYGAKIPQMIEQGYIAYINAPEGEETDAMMDALDGYQHEIDNYESPLLDAVESMFTIAAIVVSGIFAYNIYKRKTVDTIHKYRSRNPDPRTYRTGLVVMGGTSGGMLAVGLLIIFAVPFLVLFALTLFYSFHYAFAILA